MCIDEVSHWYVAGGSAGALGVHVSQDAGRTADVVVADDTATESHATV